MLIYKNDIQGNWYQPTFSILSLKNISEDGFINLNSIQDHNYEVEKTFFFAFLNLIKVDVITLKKYSTVKKIIGNLISFNQEGILIELEEANIYDSNDPFTLTLYKTLKECQHHYKKIEFDKVIQLSITNFLDNKTSDFPCESFSKKTIDIVQEMNLLEDENFYLMGFKVTSTKEKPLGTLKNYIQQNNSDELLKHELKRNNMLFLFNHIQKTLKRQILILTPPSSS